VGEWHRVDCGEIRVKMVKGVLKEAGGVKPRPYCNGQLDPKCVVGKIFGQWEKAPWAVKNNSYSIQ
jgi:hypothetical protein